MLEEMSHLLKISISKKVVLHNNFTRGIPLIKADPSQLQQIAMNLILNASDAIGDKSGAITVSTGTLRADKEFFADAYVKEDMPEGDYVYLEVTDTGCGMDGATKAKIFDPFFTTKFTGRGLGLAAVLGIVRGHHGAIKVQSEPGQGSIFTVVFPFASGAPEPGVPKPEPFEAEWRGRGFVLVVDDEAGVREVAARMLERQGFTALAAADGQEAIRIFKEHASDITTVLLDVTMPDMSGQEVFVEMRKIRPDIRVILVSGYNEEDAVRQFGHQDLAGFIQKPFILSNFLQSIHRMMQN
jgi:CheY-like chemotaxis protein